MITYYLINGFCNEACSLRIGMYTIGKETRIAAESLVQVDHFNVFFFGYLNNGLIHFLDWLVLPILVQHWYRRDSCYVYPPCRAVCHTLDKCFVILLECLDEFVINRLTQVVGAAADDIASAS